jgi:spermidine/putrescine transport system permease protein
MSSRNIMGIMVMGIMVGFYVILFFVYLFGPLFMMGASAFNQSPFPQVAPWEGFTMQWFGALLANDDMMSGIKNSLIIGVGVIFIAVPISLAAALMMTQIYEKVRPIYYVIVVSPVLTPGVILGISTLVFWDKLGTLAGAEYESLYYDGIFLSVVGQSTFISAYCMLIFLARLQRFDKTQEEAALDLGATHVQVFWKILIPFLRPAIFSAAVLAFLTSFENYNTTVFTIQAESTLTTVLSGQIRLGTKPDVSALAVIIVLITLVGATAHEIVRRREQAKEEAAKEALKRAEAEADMKLAAKPLAAS